MKKEEEEEEAEEEEERDDEEADHLLVVGVVRLFDQWEGVSAQALLDLYQLGKLKHNMDRYIDR